jgi:DedD protein
MAKQTTEEEFNLRRQTRRRLIGAIALVLLVVILLPVVFDSEPAPAAGNNIELRIPNKDDAGDFQPRIDLPELDKMDAAAASSVESAPVVASAPAAAPKPVAKPAAPAQPVNKTKIESQPVVKAQVVPKSGWAVQVGAFANADTARNLQAKLSKQGYHAYTEKTGSVMRVRVGSYPTLEAAEKVKSKLEVQGMASNVVNLE